MKKHLVIEFGKTFLLAFRLLDHELTHAWIKCMEQRQQYSLDDPRRFYGFGSHTEQEQDATSRIVNCINSINSYQPIIEREFTNIHDQDLLNYLHNIFERYHGLLDYQGSDWWRQAPTHVKEGLALLNILVHRCESVSRGSFPRFVCTWWNMPKQHRMTQAQIESNGELDTKFGGVYLNYTEIGKTLEDLSIDNDHYIGDDAFQPWQGYSADFNVRFYNRAADLERCAQYYNQHREFFTARGINSLDHYLVKPYRYRIAQLDTDLSEEEVLDKIADHREVTDIYFL